MLTRLHHDVLDTLFGARLRTFELAAFGPRKRILPNSAVRGYIDGVTPATVHAVLEEIESRHAKHLVLDGSNLGEVARAARQAAPDLAITTLFHNVEARFFLGSLRQEKSVHAFGVLVANYLAERKAVRHSDRLICLSERDRGLLKRVYGRAGTDVCPMAVRDALPATWPPAEQPRDGYALFVGGSFYANRAGIQWFVRHVAPRIALRTCVVGRGLENLRAELELPGKVEVVGEVDDLAAWYAGAKVVIAPIFDGSGMKTKVAEALMFGKKVIGTPDAFAGYEAVAHEVGRTCRTADEFVAAIDDVDSFVTAPFDPKMRALYETHYSAAAYQARLKEILEAAA